MNAKKIKEIQLSQAYQILDMLLMNNLWDPVVTNRMSDVQCENRFNKAIIEYFKYNKNLLYWNKTSSINILLENKEIIPMMKEYKFHKYKEEHNIKS